MSESLSRDKVLDSAHSLIVSALHASLPVVSIAKTVYAYGYSSHTCIFQHLCNILCYKSRICGHAPVKTQIDGIAQKFGEVGIKKRFSAGDAELYLFQVEVLLNIS